MCCYLMYLLMNTPVSQMEGNYFRLAWKSVLSNSSVLVVRLIFEIRGSDTENVDIFMHTLSLPFLKSHCSLTVHRLNLLAINPLGFHFTNCSSKLTSVVDYCVIYRTWSGRNRVNDLKGQLRIQMIGLRLENSYCCCCCNSP